MNLFQRYLADEFAEDYSEGRISRRDALKLIASVTGSLLTANSILAACAPQTEAAGPDVIPATDALPTDGSPTDMPPDDPPMAESAAPPSPARAPRCGPA